MKQDNLWDFYQNEGTEAFSGSFSRLNYLARLCRRFSSPDRKRILDVGIGSGIFETYALSLGLDVYALDPNERAIQALATSMNLRGRVRVGHSQRNPFDSNFFDVVVASELLEHLSAEELRGTISETARVLSPHGYFIGTVPANENLMQQFVVCPECSHHFHRWGHTQSFSLEQIFTLLEAGFKDCKVFLRFFPNRPPSMVFDLPLFDWCYNILRKFFAWIGIMRGGACIIFIAQKQ